MVALAATRRRRTASSCARSPCPSPTSAHRRAAGSCERDSRLTHRLRRPAPVTASAAGSIVEHVACARGELVSALARARRGVSGGTGWQGKGRASCRRWRPDGGPAWLGSRAGLWWPSRGQAAAGGVACLGRARRGSPPGRTGSLLGPPAPSTRRGSHGRAAPGSPSKLPAPPSPRRCARHRVAALAAAGACDASAGAGPSLGGVPRAPW